MQLTTHQTLRFSPEFLLNKRLKELIGQRHHLRHLNTVLLFPSTGEEAGLHIIPTITIPSTESEPGCS